MHISAFYEHFLLLCCVCNSRESQRYTYSAFAMCKMQWYPGEKIIYTFSRRQIKRLTKQNTEPNKRAKHIMCVCLHVHV